MLSIEDKILKRIRSKGRGLAFTAKDFLDIAGRAAVDQALSRLTSQGTIRRVCRGVYDYPRFSKLLNTQLSPDYDAVAHAIARESGARIQPSGATAANLLGLSEQVPAKILYLTDRMSRIVRVGGHTIRFKRMAPKNLLGDEKTAAVLQAIRFLGKHGITDIVVRKIQRLLMPIERKRLLKNAQYTSDWVADVARRVAREVDDTDDT